MRTKSKTLVCLLLGLVMLLSLAGFGIISFADDVVGKQATADAERQDHQPEQTSRCGRNFV